MRVEIIGQGGFKYVDSPEGTFDGVLSFAGG